LKGQGFDEMTRAEFRGVLAVLDLSERRSEEVFREKMVQLIDSGVDCFERGCFPAHFTGSALVVSADGARALLHHHRKLDRWLQFGGHCDGEEDVLRVAQREALEESGISELIVASARPFDLDIHEIPAHGSEPGHFHYDVRWMLIAPEGAEFVMSEESHELRWFTPVEMRALGLGGGLQRLVMKWEALVARRAGHSSGA
jgi:8-oxo-dGTP pyrophosphatase MutT (NUDIX family)